MLAQSSLTANGGPGHRSNSPTPVNISKNPSASNGGIMSKNSHDTNYSIKRNADIMLR